MKSLAQGHIASGWAGVWTEVQSVLLPTMDTASQLGKWRWQMRARKQGKGTGSAWSMNGFLLGAKAAKWWKAVSILKDLSIYLEPHNTHEKKIDHHMIKLWKLSIWVERNLQSELAYSWHFLIKGGAPWQWREPQGNACPLEAQVTGNRLLLLVERLDYGADSKTGQFYKGHNY